jgi:predicted nucleic acid-binding protein
MFYVERHFLSHSLQLADALIGATALVYDLHLLTGNVKHYRMINELKMKNFKP